VAGEDLLAAGAAADRVGEKVEGDAGFLVRRLLGTHLETEGQECVDQPPLGGLDADPAVAVALDR